jgi:dienelactone hydrolase
MASDQPLDDRITPQPFYSDVRHYTTTIGTTDSADIYFPNLSKRETKLPIVLILQGALVDKSNYSNFASQVASYGFVVVIPNHERTISNPDGSTLFGLLSEQDQVNKALAQMRLEDNDPTSPLFEIVNTSKLGLIGHSHGGAAVLGATQTEFCVPRFCSPGYSRPQELKAAFAYGAAFGNPQTQEYLPLNNQGVAIGLILGSLDGIAPPKISQATYEQILKPPKALITVLGANHYSITNADNSEREPNRPILDQATAIATISRWSGLFLRATMLGDRSAFNFVFGSGDALDPNVSVMSQI